LREFRLYGTSACHLCELAHGLVGAVQHQREDFVLKEIDIGVSDELFARYGERIPVLQHPDGSELYWPFSMDDVLEFLGA